MPGKRIPPGPSVVKSNEEAVMDEVMEKVGAELGKVAEVEKVTLA
jgi:hypothetical protein